MFGKQVLFSQTSLVRIVPWEGAPGWRGKAVPDFRQFSFTGLPWIELRSKGLHQGGIRCIKASRSRHVLRIENPAQFGAGVQTPVYAKRYLINTLRRRWGNLLSGGKAAREFHLGRRLIQIGLPTPEPLAYVMARPGRIFRPPAPLGYAAAASFLLTREKPHQGTLYDWAHSGRTAAHPLFYPLFAAFLAEMHRRGFYHDDCSGHNFCVAPGADLDRTPDLPEAILDRFIIFDIDHGHYYFGGVSPRLRAANLFQVIRSLRSLDMASIDARWLFLESYLEAAGLDPLRYRSRFARWINRLARHKINKPLLVLPAGRIP